MQPIDILATAMAYVSLADGNIGREEKAHLYLTIGKLVGITQMTEEQMKEVVQKAFKYAQTQDYEAFLDIAFDALTAGQANSVLLNMYDLMLCDGSIAAGEKKMIDRWRARFDVDPQIMTAFRQLLIVKNDTRMFMQSEHPCNEAGFSLNVRLVAAEQ